MGKIMIQVEIKEQFSMNLYEFSSARNNNHIETLQQK
jgi:hypothetical protein